MMDEELRQALGVIQEDIKKLLPLVGVADRHDKTLYGNGHDGVVTTVEQLKTTNRMYNKLFSGVGAILTFFLGNVLWRWYGGK